MADEIIEEEVSTTPEEDYQAEYDKAWSDDEEELEQPNEEVTSEVDEPDEAVVEEDSSEEEIADEDVKVEESDKSSDDFAETLKWNKQEIPVTRDELISLAQKGFDADKKWREAAVDRPLKEIISDNKLTAEELTMFADVLRNKNSDALALMAEKAGIDLYEAERKNYQPVVEQKNYALDDVIAEINNNEDIATQMNDYVSSVPQGVKDTLTGNPEILRGLNIDMQNGVAQKVMPEVIKQLALNPNQDFVSLYQNVGRTMYSNEALVKEEVVKTEPKQQATREDKKRVAVSKRNSAPKDKPITDDYDRAWDDDKHFEAVRARLSGF